MQYTLRRMNIGQPTQLKCQLGVFTHLSVGQLYPNVEQRCPSWSRDEKS